LNEFVNKSVMATPPSTDPRPARTRLAILNAAAELLSRMSIDGITVDDITATAAVSKGSFYNHFADKDALARAVSDHIRTQIESAVTTANTGIADPAERLCRAICTFVAFAIADPVKARVMLMGYMQGVEPNTPLNTRMLADLTEGIARKHFTIPSLPAAALLVMGTTFMALQNALSPNSTQHTTPHLCTLLLRAFGMPQAAAQSTATRAAVALIERTI
jgi:AcrR family transcriptional regulator